jgi:hypothetical protein
MKFTRWPLGSATLITMLMVLPSLHGNAQNAAGQVKQAPSSLVEVGDVGENIYDLAKTKEWPKVTEKLKTLQAAALKLNTDLKGVSAELKRLTETIKALSTAVAAKDEHATKRQANQVTFIAADLIGPFNPEVPSAVTKLDFYGRELEIWGAVKDTAKLKVAGDAVRQTWDKLQPAVKAKGGTTEAKKFSELMTQLAAAKTVEDYARLTTPILDEVDNLEHVFKKK